MNDFLVGGAGIAFVPVESKMFSNDFKYFLFALPTGVAFPVLITLERVLEAFALLFIGVICAIYFWKKIELTQREIEKIYQEEFSKREKKVLDK